MAQLFVNELVTNPLILKAALKRLAQFQERCAKINQQLHIPQERTPMKAIWNGAIIAQSDETVVLEGNHYFPASSLNRDHVTFSNHHSMCAWKGEASYYSLLVNGEMNTDAVWYYPNPKPEADNIKGHVAFWKGVKIES